MGTRVGADMDSENSDSAPGYRGLLRQYLNPLLGIQRLGFQKQDWGLVPWGSWSNNW